MLATEFLIVALEAHAAIFSLDRAAECEKSRAALKALVDAHHRHADDGGTQS
jgi:hypothetical protein